MKHFAVSALQELEAEAIHVFREAAAEFARPVMMYSVGKDSSVLLRLAQKAFGPGRVPFPLLHIDTSFKFAEMIAFRPRVPRVQGGVAPAPEPVAPGDEGDSQRTSAPMCCRKQRNIINGRTGPLSAARELSDRPFARLFGSSWAQRPNG